jgi:drug/metabolite transporter superfamily protein YnfA
MKKNMGAADRIIRVVLAVVFLALFLTDTVTGTFGWVLAALGVVFLLTSLVSFCPLYLPFGLSTCKTQDS